MLQSTHNTRGVVLCGKQATKISLGTEHSKCGYLGHGIILLSWSESILLEQWLLMFIYACESFSICIR